MRQTGGEWLPIGRIPPSWECLQRDFTALILWEARPPCWEREVLTKHSDRDSESQLLIKWGGNEAKIGPETRRPG